MASSGAGYWIVIFRRTSQNCSVESTMSDQSAGIAQLVWEDPVTHEPRTFILRANDDIVIGRLDTCDICIPERHMSRQHARIWYKDGTFYLDDSMSSSGCFVNNRRLTEALR